MFFRVFSIASSSSILVSLIIFLMVVLINVLLGLNQANKVANK